MTSDLFVFPSYREGLSVALMEAMICELPVVCSNIRGNYDLIQHGRNGLLVNPDQVNGFSDAIFKMFTDRSIQTIFSRNNKADINKYSIKNVTYMMKKIYS